MIKQLYKEQDKNNKKNNQDPPNYNGDEDGNAIMPLKQLALPTEQQWNTLKSTLPQLRTDEFHTRNYTLEYSPKSTKNKTFAFSPYMADNESIIPREDGTLP